LDTVGIPESFIVEKARKTQRMLALKVRFEGLTFSDVSLVGGVDVAYTSKSEAKAAAAILNFETLELVEYKVVKSKVRFPYVPTLLSFREAPPIFKVIAELKAKPDVILVDGQGVAHPYRCGLASHVGVILDIPTIGVAKKPLCGEVGEFKGNQASIMFKGREVGKALLAREKMKPIYVSVGHKISLEEAVKIVLRSIKPGRRIPEPIRIAHLLSKQEFLKERPFTHIGELSLFSGRTRMVKSAKPQEWFLLLRLAEHGALRHPIFITTGRLASELECSQQTVSRWLRNLSRNNYIERRVGLRGEYVQITKKGREELLKTHSKLSLALKPVKGKFIAFKGVVFTGLGEGAYYITREGYRRQFVVKLGYKPYPGTLNLKLVNSKDLTVRMELETLPGIIINGFHNGVRSYGSLKCLPATIEDKLKGHVLLIQRTHYNSSVIELISPVCIREALKLKDGNTVRVKVPLTEFSP
jgi:deoxyribonuclease V